MSERAACFGATTATFMMEPDKASSTSPLALTSWHAA